MYNLALLHFRSVIMVAWLYRHGQHTLGYLLSADKCPPPGQQAKIYRVFRPANHQTLPVYGWLYKHAFRFRPTRSYADVDGIFFRPDRSALQRTERNSPHINRLISVLHCQSACRCNNLPLKTTPSMPPDQLFPPILRESHPGRRK